MNSCEQTLLPVRLQQPLCDWHLDTVVFCKAAFASGTSYSPAEPRGCFPRLPASLSSGVLPQLLGFSCYPGSCAVLQTNHVRPSLTQLSQVSCCRILECIRSSRDWLVLHIWLERLHQLCWRRVESPGFMCCFIYVTLLAERMGIACSSAEIFCVVLG